MTDLLLTDVLQKLYRGLGQLSVTKATGGTNQTAIDTRLKGVFSGNPFKDGVLFVIRSTDGLAPQGEFERISTYNSSSQTFTLDDVLSAVIGTGDVIGYADATYPYLNMIETINDALQALGEIDLVDAATLTTASDQTEYAASVAWKRTRPRRIEYASNPTDANDQQWIQWDDFDWVPAAAGVAGTIIFNRQPPVDTTPIPIRIWYVDMHPIVSAYNDKINETVPVELLVAKSIEKALDFQNKLQSGQDDALLGFLADARREYDRAEVHHKREPVKAHPKTMNPKFHPYR